MKPQYFLFLPVLFLLYSCNKSGEESRGRGNLNPEQMIERQITRMDEAMDLSENQKDDLTEIFKEFGERQMRLRNSGKEREEIRAEMIKINSEREDKIKEILDPDQLVEWEKIKEDFANRRRRENP